MEIPFFDIRRVDKTKKQPILNAVKKVIESGKFILDKEVERFEREFSRFIGTKYSIGVASGTDAILLSLISLDVKGKNIITTPFTFVSTAEAIVKAGGTLIFADIQDDGFLMDLDNAASKIDRKTGGIIPVHLFGEMLDVKRLKAIVKGIPIIEDCAQSFGSFRDTNKAGSLGLTGCFSFFPTKNLGAYGDGGMITTNSSVLYKRLTSLRAHGKVGDKYTILGYNSRLDEVQAAILMIKMRYFEEDNRKKIRIAKRYIQGLKGFVKVPIYKEGYTFHQFTIRTEGRDKLKEFLKKNGIQTKIYYPIPLHLHPLFKNGYKKGAFPNSEKRAKESLSLPVFPDLTDNEIDYIVQNIRNFFKHR